MLQYLVTDAAESWLVLRNCHSGLELSLGRDCLLLWANGELLGPQMVGGCPAQLCLVTVYEGASDQREDGERRAAGRIEGSVGKAESL